MAEVHAADLSRFAGGGLVLAARHQTNGSSSRARALRSLQREELVGELARAEKLGGGGADGLGDAAQHVVVRHAGVQRQAEEEFGGEAA